MEAAPECPEEEEEEKEEEEDWPPLEREAAAVRLLIAAITREPLTGWWVGEGDEAEADAPPGGCVEEACCC